MVILFYKSVSSVQGLSPSPLKNLTNKFGHYIKLPRMVPLSLSSLFPSHYSAELVIGGSFLKRRQFT